MAALLTAAFQSLPPTGTPHPHPEPMSLGATPAIGLKSSFQLASSCTRDEPNTTLLTYRPPFTFVKLRKLGEPPNAVRCQQKSVPFLLLCGG